MRRLLLLVAPLLLANAEAAPPQTGEQPIPAPIKAMLDAALASGNDGEIGTIAKYAREADPASGDAVLAQVNAWRADREAKRREVIQEARFIDLWTGKVELGGFLTTGNTRTAGFNTALGAAREGLRWRNKFELRYDYQRSLGITTREHFLASYEPNYKIDDRLYAYGQGQYESDRFFGFDERLSLSAGAGYSAIKRPALTLDVELGPAWRRTSYTDLTDQSSPGARGSLDLKWKLLPGLSVTQEASAYIQRYNSTVTSATALNAKLIGPLSAQLSYNLQYESMPPAGSVTTDTTSRAALVYSF